MESCFDLSRVKILLGDLAGRCDIDAIAECDSTNTQLMLRAENGAPSGSVLITDQQTHGRGRRGRQWLSESGKSLTFSILWRFPNNIELSGLSLAVGIAIVSALRPLGADAWLKWPNDIWLDEKKLGGVLVEINHSIHATRTATIIGIGLNLATPQSLQHLNQPCIGLAQKSVETTREILSAAILRTLIPILDAFAVAGFTPWREIFMRMHALQGKQVSVDNGKSIINGICGDVDARGVLCIHTAQGEVMLWEGDVSLRKTNAPTTTIENNA